MRAVADTNTVVSGLLWHGAPRQVLDAARANQIELFVTTGLLLELEDVLQREKFAARLNRANVSAHELVLGYAALAELIEAAVIERIVLADADDDAVLACALAANADAIVSGDSHLLNLKSFKNIPIQSAAEILKQLA